MSCKTGKCFSKNGTNQERTLPDNNEPIKPLVWSHQDNEKDEAARRD
jgi:hypothetical protein